MGMQSYFDYEEITIINLEGLKKFMKEYIEKYPTSIVAFDDINMIREDSNGKPYFTFENWTEMKIVSYWYDQDVLFLEMVAPYIEGEAHWTFESVDEVGAVFFENGKCRFELGEMKYKDYQPKELMTSKGFKIDEGLEQLKNNALLLRKVEEQEI